MSVQEYQYHEGFVDGQLNIIEIWDDCVDSNDDFYSAALDFHSRLDGLRKELESL
jgi:hypothetical protein